MTFHRLALPLSLLAAAAAAQPPAPGKPGVVSVPGVSAAGNAALAKFNGRIDPAGKVLAGDEAAFQQQIGALLSAPTIDPDKFAALLKQGQTLASRGQAIRNDHLVTMVRALPPADRAPFLRAVLGARPAGAPAR